RSAAMPDKQTVWLGRIEACQASGESVAAYCRSQGLTYSQFIYWQGRLRTSSRDDAPRLVPLVIRPEAVPVAHAPVELEPPGGVRVRVACSSMIDVTALVRGLAC